MRKFSVPLLAFLIAVPAGCGNGDPARDGFSDRSAEVELRAVRDITIGRYEGPEEYVFGRIGAIAQHPDGTTFIADPQVPLIRRYADDGTYLHDVGRVGEGPGEYQDIQAMELLPDGNLGIWDIGNRRVVVFEPDGDYVMDFPVDSGLHTSSQSFQIDDHGNFYVLKTERSPEETTNFPPKVFLKFGPDGEPLGKVELPSDEPETPGFVLSTPEGFLRNFTRGVHYALGPRGHLVVGHNDDYSFEFRRGDEVLMEIGQAWEPVRLKPEEKAQWQAWTDYVQERSRSNANRPGFTNWEVPEYEPIPDTKPAFMGIYTGEDGSIWIRRYAEAHQRDRPPREPDDPRPPLTWFQPPTWDVFDEEGVFIGTVELPPDTRVAEFHTEYLWCVRPDEHDESVAVRYRIEPGVTEREP